MTAGRFAVGLDIGTTKICAIVGRGSAGLPEIAGLGSAPSLGIRKGIVVDVDLTADCIRKALKEAEDMAGVRIGSVYVGIAGGHIKGFGGYGVVEIKGRRVSEDDVERLLDSAGAVYVPADRDILHVIPTGFKLSGSNGIKNPVGMQGGRLEAKVHIVTGAVAPVQNLIRSCGMAGVEVEDIVLEPLASADSVLSPAEKEKGVALIDLGGGTTDIAVYKGGELRHTAVLALGGNHISNDIAVAFDLSLSEAERIKKEYGSAVADTARTCDDNEHGDMPDTGQLAEVIRARCEEIISLVRKETGIAAGVGGHFIPSVSDVVLTGGASLLKGLRELAAEMLGLPVRIGIPEGVGGKDPVNSPAYSTAIGLVRYGLSRMQADADAPHPSLTSAGIFEHMKQWVSGFLNKVT